jgi:hypothetical protein
MQSGFMYTPTGLVIFVSLGRPLFGWWSLIHTTTNLVTFVLPGGPLCGWWILMHVPTTGLVTLLYTAPFDHDNRHIKLHCGS